MKKLIIFKSRQGAAKQYAEWLKEAEPAADIFALHEFQVADFVNYDKIVFVSSVYYGTISAAQYLIANWDLLAEKDIFLVTVGLRFNEADNSIREAFEKLPANIQTKVQFTKLPGKIDAKQLNLIERFLARVLLKSDNIDKTDKSLLSPAIDFLKD